MDQVNSLDKEIRKMDQVNSLEEIRKKDQVNLLDKEIRKNGPGEFA